MASEGGEQCPDVEVVDAVLEDAPAESDVTLTEGIQSSASVLKENCVENFDQAASIADINDSMNKVVTTQTFSCYGYTALEIMAIFGNIT